MNTSKLVYRVCLIIGIIIFIFGLFDLTETRFGYDSAYMRYGLAIMCFSYLLSKINYLIELNEATRR